MANYFDKILYLYPGIQGVSYWQTQYDGTPWKNPYDGIVWENTSIPKPSQATLDALDDATVTSTLASRAEVARKAARDANYKTDIPTLSNYDMYVKSNPTVTFSQYLDYLESLGKTLN